MSPLILFAFRGRISLLNLNVFTGFPLWASPPCALQVLPILVALFFYFVILIVCALLSRILQVALCVVSLISIVFFLTLFLFEHLIVILAALIFFILFLIRWTHLSQQSSAGTLLQFLMSLWTVGALIPLFVVTHLSHCLLFLRIVVLLMFGDI